MAKPRFLVVDEQNRPMVFLHSEEQFVYCKTRAKTRAKATSYVKENAEEYIRITKANRKKWNFDEGQYFLMPFE